MFQGIDLYSDTITQPTQGMRQAMVNATVGDEQKGEDPTTLQLEAKVAELLGFSAALFFPSATMANEVALKLHLQPGDELIASDQCHLFFAEVGGPAIHAGAMARPIRTETGFFTGKEVREYYRTAKGSHYPVTRLVSVENTTNMGGGLAWEKERLEGVLSAAKELTLKAHMDGARLMNASVKTGISPRALSEGFDSVTLCLTKGLGCPVGAVLAFQRTEFEKVRRLKQLMGGALRQSGMLAAAGLYALDHHIERLHEDHDNAAHFAEGLRNLSPHLQVEYQTQATNMVFFSVEKIGLTGKEFNTLCQKQGLRFSEVGPYRIRAVTHLDINQQDMDKALHTVKQVLQHYGKNL